MPNLAGSTTSATPRLLGRSDAYASRYTPQQSASGVLGNGSDYTLEGRSPPGRANEELARFFREKADRGDEPLTAIEQAGVFHLMQQGEWRSTRLESASVHSSRVLVSSSRNCPYGFHPQF